MTSPWGKITVEPVDFQNIMSEEYARGLQDKENQKLGQRLAASQQQNREVAQENVICDVLENSRSFALEVPVAGASGNTTRNSTIDDTMVAEVMSALKVDMSYNLDDFCESDSIIAEMLQAQFDRDHDIEVKRIERQQNKDSKVSVSYSKYRTVPDELLYDSDLDEEPDDRKKHWDRFETNEKAFDGMPKKGFTYDKDGLMVTKHDEQLNGVRNACRVMSFPPEFHTGDAAGFDMKLPNSVFNQLKTYSLRTKKTRAHDRRENVATAEMGIDERTRLILYKLVNNQILEQINGVISTGKEAVILHADSDSSYEGDLALPKECAIKIFKTTLNEFKQRDRYIKDDYRFKDRFSKQNNRTVINMWAEKEMHNLMRMRDCGIRCPEVVTLKKHVLIMSFIGENNIAAPKIKDVQLSAADTICAYEECMYMMHRLYNDAKLVHADLSEYNILWHQDRCWFIDVAQVDNTKKHDLAYGFNLNPTKNIHFHLCVICFFNFLVR